MNKHKSNTLNKHSTPELLHHSNYGRRSELLGQALPASNKRFKRFSQAEGFTIIEVVLVLAIAGLIFLMVFIALPALQRSQRDTRRKNDAGRLKDAIDRYKANNRGRVPYDGEVVVVSSVNNHFARTYLRAHEGEFNSPTSQAYNVFFNSNTIVPSTRWRNSGPLDNNIDIVQGERCDGEYIIPADGSNRYIVYMKLEGGGNYCLGG